MVMAVTAVLIGLAAYGTSLVQRNSRNTQRIDILNSMVIGIEKYYSRNGNYPNSNSICALSAPQTLRICLRGTETCSSCTDAYDIEYEENSLTPNTATSKTNTAYCYINGADSSIPGTYVVGIQKEAQAGVGEWVVEGAKTELPICSASVLFN